MFSRESARANQSFRNDVKHGKRFNTQTGQKIGHPIERGKQPWSWSKR